MIPLRRLFSVLSYPLPSMGRVTVSAFVVGALAAAVAGCGGSGKKDGYACYVALNERAAAAVVERLYAAGKLGTASEVRRQSSKEHPFLRKDGTMIPFARMTAWQRAELDDWRESGPVQRVAGSELASAYAGVDRAAMSRCGFKP
jgi:hypothetical protein